MGMRKLALLNRIVVMDFRAMRVQLLILPLMLCFFGCSERSLIEGQEVGTNGEPPRDLPIIYQKQFVAEEKNYVLALGLVHSYLVENDFYAKYTDCFDHVLDVRKRKPGFSCLALRAEKGPPTKVYFRVLIDEVLYNQLDGNNRLKYTLEMYALEYYKDNGVADDLIHSLESGIELELPLLYSVSEDAVHNKIQ